LHHSEGRLSNVVGEGDGGVVDETENLVDVVTKPDGEVPGGPLCDVPAALVAATWRRPGGEQTERGVEDLVVAGLDVIGGVGVEVVVAGGQGRVGRGLGVQ